MNEKKYMRSAKCKKCGKEFIPAPYHIYRDGSKYYCKWTCYNHRNDKPEEVKENEEIIENL
jgi:hypothetical protein